MWGFICLQKKSDSDTTEDEDDWRNTLYIQQKSVCFQYLWNAIMAYYINTLLLKWWRLHVWKFEKWEDYNKYIFLTYYCVKCIG